MQKSKKTAPLFVAHCENGHGYSHLHLAVMEKTPWSQSEMWEVLTLRWQANADSRGDWYGLHVTTDHNASHAERAARAARLVAKLIPADERGRAPSDVLARLSALGIARGAYDSRESQFVREVDAAPAYLDRYLDDHKAQGAPSCAVGALARDEEHAKLAIEKAFAESILKGYTSAERFAQWVGAGKPVLVAYGSHPPQFPAMATLLNAPEVPEVAA